MNEALALIAPDACLCNEHTHTPAVPAPSLTVALVAEIQQTSDEYHRLLASLGNRRFRTLPEAAAAARLALGLHEDDAHPILVRIARFVLRLEADAARQGVEVRQ